MPLSTPLARLLLVAVLSACSVRAQAPPLPDGPIRSDIQTTPNRAAREVAEPLLSEVAKGTHEFLTGSRRDETGLVLLYDDARAALDLFPIEPLDLELSLRILAGAAATARRLHMFGRIEEASLLGQQTRNAAQMLAEQTSWQPALSTFVTSFQARVDAVIGGGP